MRDYSNSHLVSIDEFTIARNQFNSLVSVLASNRSNSWEHSKVEDYIKIEGTEILRLLFQAHLDCRSNGEEKIESLLGADGVDRTHHREGTIRGLETLFGRVSVARRRYGANGYPSLFPLDAKLNLPPNVYSIGLQRVVGIEAAKSSFDSVSNSVSEYTGGHIPKRQIERIAARCSQDFDDFYSVKECSNTADLDDPLILTIDGKGIVVRTQDLREVTQKAAQSNEQKLKHRRSKGEKPNRKRIATVAAVYTQERFERIPEEILGIDEEDDAPKWQLPRPKDKRVFASIEKTSLQAMDEVFREALRRDPEQKRQWIVLVDGDRQQIRRVNQMSKKYSATVTIIVDFIHVLEYIWKAAYGFYDDGSEDAEDWVTERALRVLYGEASQVAAGMRRSATRRRLSKVKRKAVDDCANYLLRKKRYLKYDKYLSQGLAIATGVIEGTCRYLVKDRMDITGARWSLEGAEAILKLRALLASGDFEEYWEFYKQQELARNHISKYGDGEMDRLLAA